MKLKKLEVVSVLGIARADIDLSHSVTLIAGSNESGKSSVRDSISMAFLGKPCRVDTKKELGQLLHDEAQKGRISVQFGGADDGAEFRLPKGDHLVSEFDGAASMPFLLDPALFARISADDRRSFLFGLTKCQMSGAVVRQKLTDRGITEDLIDEITPELRKGFPHASGKAYDRAKAAKGAWRQVTGATWGSNVAEGWRAEKPEGLCPTSKELDEIMAKHDAAQNNVEKGTAYVGGLDSKRKASESYVSRKASAKAIADQLHARQDTLTEAEAELSELEAALAPMQQKLSEMQAGVIPVACPCCAAELTITGQTLKKFEGLKADAKAASDLAFEITKKRQSIGALKGMMPNYIGSVAEAKAALTQLAAIEEEKVEVIDQAAIESATAKLARCREQATELRAEFNTKQQTRSDFAKVEEVTAAATKAHEEVKAWLAIGDALAPDGIPAEILKGALAPVNQSLAVLSGMCGWKAAVINEDMTLSYGGRIYELNSESGQWRFDALMALAIAQISEVKIVVLDRFDVLDFKARGALMKMLLELGKMGLMDNSILCGTMKEMPKLPQGMGGAWIERGLAEMAVAP